MVFLFGNKDYYDPLGYIVVKCPGCKKRAVFAVQQERKKLTLYFVPTFQYAKRQIITCSQCQQSFEVEDELKPNIEKNLISEKKLKSLQRSGKLQEMVGGRRKKVADSRCPSCDSKIQKGMVYCPQCGNKL